MVVSWCPALILIFVGLTNAYDWTVTTALDTYVHSDDGFYAYEELTSHDYEGVTIYILNMTSQKYQDETYVSNPVWWHIMGIAIPDEITYPDFGILWIGDGNNDDDPIIPPADDIKNQLISSLANDSKVIVGYIKQVPNQPTVFADDPSQTPRYENDFIAWTWRSYLNNPTPSNLVLARMPMTKAAKRGLDTIRDFAAEKLGATITRFAAAGPSEGGWTTWSLAATDQRVVVMAPMVFSLLNAQTVITNHFQDMDGAWSFAFQPYYKENLTQEFFNPKTEGIYDVEDMYRYRERLTIPIFTVLASGDELFLPEESQYWWNDIPSPSKYMYMLANAEHYMLPHYNQIYAAALSALLTFLEERPYPQVTWEISHTATGGQIILHTNPPPINLIAWKAVTLGNDTRRDFRLLSGTPPEIIQHPVRWNRGELEIIDLGGGNYSISADNVVDEWVGFFFEGQWPGPAGDRMTFTSQVCVTPNTFPHPPCSDAVSCYGSLV